MIGSRYEYESDIDCGETNQDVEYQRKFYESYHQQVSSENEKEIDRKACNMLSTIEHINLRKPSKEEIDQIICLGAE